MIDTQFIGRQLIEIDEVDSTNLYAQDLLKNQKVPDGTVIKADFQSKGRGQMGTQWISEANANLTFSIILYPSFLSIEKQFYLSKITTLGILDAINTLAIQEVKIKWPNDIYLKNKKVCGILIENAIKVNRIESTILGIGLNINQTNFNDYANSATSLFLQAGLKQDKNLIFSRILKYIEMWYFALKDEKWQEIDALYLKRLMNYQIWADYEINQKVISAKIINIKDSGSIILEFEDSSSQEFSMKEIKFII